MKSMFLCGMMVTVGGILAIKTVAVHIFEMQEFAYESGFVGIGYTDCGYPELGWGLEIGLFMVLIGIMWATVILSYEGPNPELSEKSDPED